MSNKTEVSKTNQTESGKAFEYSVVLALYKKINNGQLIKLEKNSSFYIAKNSYEKFDMKEQQNYNKAAEAAINHIVKLEPRLEYPMSNDEITIIIQPDNRGKSGDIRDIITVRSKYNWEIGFSAKNNNMAVKHCRLSSRIDFGKEWFAVSCSEEYMNEAKNIFEEVKHLKNQSKEQKYILKWNDIGNKKYEFYTRNLDNFKTEISRLSKSTNSIPEHLLKYLIGKHDFYKIMKFNNYIRVQGFNFNGTLNKSSGLNKSPIKVSKLTMPTKIETYTMIRNNKLVISLDKGWQLSFRIHNASSNVESSLKFDVQLEGVPPNLYTHEEFWY